MRTRFLSLLLLAAATLAAALHLPAAASAKAAVGIADQKAAMFDDPRFTGLGVRHVRIFVPYDWTTNPHQLRTIDDWMKRAESARVRPLITVERSSDPRRRHRAPSVDTYRKQIRKMRQRYRFVREYSVWNEANHGGQPLSKKPALAARYYRVLAQECKGCRILAADLLDQPNMVRWAKDFTRALGREPKHWGLHNYIDANRFSTKGTRRLLAAVKGKVWLTETGGVVRRKNTTVRFRAQGEAHAAAVTRFILGPLARLSPRIERIYLYHWNSSTPTDSWDSAFIAADGRERPALGVLRARLGK